VTLTRIKSRKNPHRLQGTLIHFTKPKNKMSNQEISKMIAQLQAAIANHEQQENEDKKQIILGLDLTLEQLNASGDAQNKVVELHNQMIKKIRQLEDRVSELEGNND
jgi:hypothetical protein